MDLLPLIGALVYFGIILLVVFILVMTGKFVSGAPFSDDQADDAHLVDDEINEANEDEEWEIHEVNDEDERIR